MGVNYINHNQTQVNVNLQWAPNGILNQDDAWLHKSPHDMEYEYKLHLAMDYVATCDIHDGEELFLDYGKEWEEAWQEHLADWEPTKSRVGSTLESCECPGTTTNPKGASMASISQ